MEREREDHEDRAPRPASVLATSSLFAEPSVLAAGSVLVTADADRPARGASLLRPADEDAARPPVVPSAARVADRLAAVLEPVLDADLAQGAQAPAVRVPDLVATAAAVAPPAPTPRPARPAATRPTAGLPGGEELSPRLRQALHQARAGRAAGTRATVGAAGLPAGRTAEPAGTETGRIVVAILLTFLSGGFGAAVAGLVLLGGRPSAARRALAWLLVVLGSLWLLALVLAAAD
ncbi:hypothetical protein SK069_01780 [Patulibacter brassicae]|jgi:hypothetical protein|uniref:Uncharacterized protein n=1 Tax=Patulibacter brassicae TaxID=1705717 RepID=A0ABU4VET9_9ACTN|nr:hypothetical protein [Patulibacter brassicae]MDX8150310.1 hypothetical protein [Patulibacter brassicae]